jgi:hypothetical protein
VWCLFAKTRASDQVQSLNFAPKEQARDVMTPYSDLVTFAPQAFFYQYV